MGSWIRTQRLDRDWLGESKGLGAGSWEGQSAWDLDW